MAFTRERRRDAYVQVRGERRRLHSDPVLAASGSLGPKPRAGDRQVPEGRDGVESLNPNSLYHLALRLDYPNACDRARAAEDGRHELGGDIRIHGSDASSRCLAMGDPTREDLFVLAAAAGPSRVEGGIVPFDLRGEPGWRPPSSLPPSSRPRTEHPRRAPARRTPPPTVTLPNAKVTLLEAHAPPELSRFREGFGRTVVGLFQFYMGEIQ